MKKTLALLALLILSATWAWSQTSPQPDPTRPGIVKTAEHTKTYVFDIQVQGIANADQATKLDAAMLSKQGILSAKTNPTTQVCRVEVLKKVTEANLRDVVTSAGFTVAKTFNQ